MIVDGRVRARRSPSATISAAGSPQIAAARSTGHSSSRSESSGQPTVWAASHSSSVPSASRITRISAERERGVGARARREVLVAALRRGRASGSMQITCARRRAPR